MKINAIVFFCFIFNIYSRLKTKKYRKFSKFKNILRKIRNKYDDFKLAIKVTWN